MQRHHRPCPLGYQFAQARGGKHLDVGGVRQQLASGDVVVLDGQVDGGPAIGVGRDSLERTTQLGVGEVGQPTDEVAGDPHDGGTREPSAVELVEVVGPVVAQHEVAGPFEAIVGRREPQDVGDPVGADLAVGGRREVPRAALEHETVGRQAALDLARRLPAAVGDVDDPVVEHRLGERGEVRGLLGRVVPRRDVEPEPVAQAPGPHALGGPERGQQLALGRGSLLAEPEGRCRAGQADHEQRQCFVLGEPGQARAVAVDEAVAARAALLGVDRDARGRQRLDVAVDRAQRDLELARQLARGHAGSGLEQHQDREEPAGTHAATVGGTADNPCQKMSGMASRVAA